MSAAVQPVIDGRDCGRPGAQVPDPEQVVEALSRSLVLHVNRARRSRLASIFQCLRALVTEPNRLGNRLFLANVTMPRRGVERQPRHIGFLPGGAIDT